MRLLRWLSPELSRAREFTRYACSLMPGATDRLLVDVKRQAHTDLTTAPAEDAAGARRNTNPITREDNES